MTKSHPNQHSFSSGELSPLMDGRSDLETYAAGTKTLRNMYSDSRGPAKNRESLRRAIEVGESPSARVETYNRTKEEFFTFVFGDFELFFIRDIENPTIAVFTSPWSASQVDDVYVVPLPDGRTFYLLHPNVAPWKLVDAVGSLVTTEITASSNFTVPAGVTELSVCVTGAGGGGGGGSGDGGGSDAGGGGGGGGSGVVKNTNVIVTPAEVIPVVIGAGGTGGASGGFLPGGDGGDGGAGGNSTFTAATVTLSSTGGGGGGGAPLGGVGVAGVGNSGGGNGGAGTRGALPIVAGNACSAICGGSSFPGGDGAYATGPWGSGGGGGGGGFGAGGNGAGNVAGPLVGILGGGGGGDRGAAVTSGAVGGGGKVRVVYTTPAAGITLSVVTFTAAPVNWAGTNWPSAGAYFQSRLWLGGTPDEAETFLSSVSGTPEDFTIGVLAADAMSYTMENFGGIEWMVGTKKRLLMGTINAEYVITSNGGVIIPGDIDADQQSAYGSASIQPVKIGDQVIYVSPDKRKIRAMNYEERQNNWMSVDLTFPSEHITAGLIKDLSWTQHPNNLLWVTLEDGTLACMSYERGNKISGWHRHDTQGTVLGAGSGFNGEKSILVLAVLRGVDNTFQLETMSDDYYFDSWLQTSLFTAIPAGGPVMANAYYIEGYGHLDGKLVQVVIDGAIHPDRIVGAESASGEGDGVAGRIYVEYSGSVAVAGLQYIPELETLDLDGGSQTGSGSAHQKRRNKMHVKVLNSGLPMINGERGNDRNSDTAMDNPEDLVTTTIETVGLDWDRKARVNVQQDLPLPLIILSIFGEISKNTL